MPLYHAQDTAKGPSPGRTAQGCKIPPIGQIGDVGKVPLSSEKLGQKSDQIGYVQVETTFPGTENTRKYQ